MHSTNTDLYRSLAGAEARFCISVANYNIYAKQGFALPIVSDTCVHPVTCEPVYIQLLVNPCTSNYTSYEPVCIQLLVNPCTSIDTNPCAYDYTSYEPVCIQLLANPCTSIEMQNVMLLKFRILLHGFMRFRHWFMYITHWFMYVACLFLFLPEQQFTRSHANVFSLQKVLHHLPTCQCLAAAVHIPLAQPPYIKHVIFVYITPRQARMNESRKNRHMHHHMQLHRHIEQLSI